MINMNLPAINNKMKNPNNLLRSEPSSMADGFGLGIQVFKIESVKHIDNKFKSKNRTAIKKIENPAQTNSFKPPLAPKPKKLPSLQKSSSQINTKERLSAFLSSKMQLGGQNIQTDKIFQRKQANIESNRIVTPVSYSMRKKANISTQKNIVSSNQASKLPNARNFIIQKQKPGKAIGTRLNQTAPPQTMYKPEQLYYQNYHTQHQVLLKFYSQLSNCQKQHLKQIKQLKKLKENQFDCQTYDRIEYLQSLQGKICSVIDTMEKQYFDQKAKQLFRTDQKKLKKLSNTIVPISGFEWTQLDCFEYDSLENYQNINYSGSFKVNDYQNVDLAPVNHQNKPQQNQQ